MIINKDYLFIHIQRSGGSFVEKFLLENFDGWEHITPKHAGLTEIPGLVSASRDKLKFGVVRNPWNWYVSWWSANTKVGDKTMFPKIFTKETLSDFNKFIKHALTSDFGRDHYINSKPMVIFDIGIYTFRYLSCHYLDFTRMGVDAILHQENLREELAELLKLSPERRKVLFDMPDYHVGSYKPFREYYNDESIDLVAHRDRFIIEKHGYSFH